jgi:hypothetical protein
VAVHTPTFLLMPPSAADRTKEKEKKERLNIPEEGKRFLKSIPSVYLFIYGISLFEAVFHNHRVLLPSQDEKDHVLRELQVSWKL